MTAVTVARDTTALPDARDLRAGLAVACGAVIAPLAFGLADPAWMARLLGAGAANAMVWAGLAGALFVGFTTVVVRATVQASPVRFLAAWGGTTVVGFLGLGVCFFFPEFGAGSGKGLLFGYGGAMIAGKLLEVPALWHAAPTSYPSAGGDA
jgi:hypothetical protein